MGIFLGLDVGDKRVGAALSDASELLATPLDTFDRAQGRAEARIVDLVSKNSISAIVVGMPYSDDGSENQQCLKVENFCRRLKKRLNIEIHYVDEYATSVEAEERLRDLPTGKRKIRSKGAIDAASAAIILQSFLDTRRDGSGSA